MSELKQLAICNALFPGAAYTAILQMFKMSVSCLKTTGYKLSGDSLLYFTSLHLMYVINVHIQRAISVNSQLIFNVQTNLIYFLIF